MRITQTRSTALHPRQVLQIQHLVAVEGVVCREPFTRSMCLDAGSCAPLLRHLKQIFHLPLSLLLSFAKAFLKILYFFDFYLFKTWGADLVECGAPPRSRATCPFKLEAVRKEVFGGLVARTGFQNNKRDTRLYILDAKDSEVAN